ncbi:MAG: GTP-binding protein [Acutalibacteraceae bacterium]|nr:GTP-binding protein [Acutalibacteraceae bacterium]
MTKIDIFSGFLGAGKTTLIKKLINEAYKGQKVVLIENEFGEIGIDGGFLQDAGIEITEMNSGCICCSLVGDFSKALEKVLCEYSPDRVLIEPSGVGKLSDVIKAVKDINNENASLNTFTAVVDFNKCKMYMKNFGEFFNDQIENASCIVLSHTKGASEEKLKACVEAIREHNKTATIITTDWDKLTGEQILEAMENKDTLNAELEHLSENEVCPECGCHHEHHHDHDHEHEHHHHDHDDECECGCHHHDHDHEHEHHHHHADDVFTSFGAETTNKYTKEQIKDILTNLMNENKYGNVLRAKGFVEGENGEWVHFDYVPGEPDVRSGKPAVTGRICVIGSKINEDAIAKLFNV